MKKVMSSIVSLFLGLILLNQPLTAAEEVDLSKLFGGKSEFLNVDEAFKLTTEIVDEEIIVKFEIADEYYLYRSRFYFDAKGAKLSDAYIPDGKKKVDDYLGDVEVYHHNLEISIPFVAQQKDVTFIIEYQGCAEAGLCYPPEEKKFSLLASTVSAPSGDSNNDQQISETSVTEKPQVAIQSKKSTKEFVPEQEQISNFLGDKSLLEIAGYMALLGILLAFTPCVLPMVPILSSIIVGQGKDITLKKSFLISVTYTQAMAIPFAFIGLLVAGLGPLIGIDINSNSLQSPYFRYSSSNNFSLIIFVNVRILRIAIAIRYAKQII